MILSRKDGKEVLIVKIALIVLLTTGLFVMRIFDPAIGGKPLQQAVWSVSENPETAMICYVGELSEGVSRPTVSVTLPQNKAGDLMAILKELHGRFVRNGLPDEAGPLQVVLKSGEYASFFSLDDDSILAVGGENGDDRIYHLNENAAYRLSSFCHTYTDLDGLYPGLAFLNEFFSIDKDGRWSIIEKAMFSSYSGAMEDAIEPYHVGIAPYMTESGLLNVELGRMLYRLELQCKTEAKDWILGAIDIQPASKKDAYCYTISLSCEKDNTRLDKYYTGSYTVDENNLVDSFYVDF